MNHISPLPGWLRAVFVAVMLGLCALLCWYAAEQYSLRFQIEDVALSLDTSRQREKKQTYENEQYTAQLPVLQQQLAETAPLAAEAVAKEQELRAQRKVLRAQSTQLDEDIAAMQQAADDALAKKAQLEETVAALRAEARRLEALLKNWQELTP